MYLWSCDLWGSTQFYPDPQKNKTAALLPIAALHYKNASPSKFDLMPWSCNTSHYLAGINEDKCLVIIIAFRDFFFKKTTICDRQSNWKIIWNLAGGSHQLILDQTYIVLLLLKIVLLPHSKCEWSKHDASCLLWPLEMESDPWLATNSLLGFGNWGI